MLCICKKRKKKRLKHFCLMLLFSLIVSHTRLFFEKLNKKYLRSTRITHSHDAFGLIRCWWVRTTYRKRKSNESGKWISLRRSGFRNGKQKNQERTSNRMVILRVSWGTHKCHVLYQISQKKTRSDCSACPTICVLIIERPFCVTRKILTQNILPIEARIGSWE